MKSEVITLLKDREDVTLTTYILEDSPEMLNGNKRPAVIVCPGGAYLSCSDREGEPVALAFTRMGYHAFVLRYSVALNPGENGFEADLMAIEPKAERMHPQPMRDIAEAFMCIHAHADEWKVDTGRIAICGFSAGAHNCAMYSTHWAKPVITEYAGADKEQLRPAACILGYPLTDYVFMKENASKDPGNFAFFNGSNTQFLGRDWDQEELLVDASPARLVDENTPPTFIWSTAADKLVPVQHSALYAFALAEKNIPFEIHIFQDCDHGLAMADQSSASAMSQISSDARKWVDLCEAWLYKYFAIKLPEKTAWESMVAQGIGK